MLYILDANVIITAKDSYYAMDQVPEFWPWLVHQAAQNHLKMPMEILEEVSAGPNKDDLFHKWRKDKETTRALLLDEEADPEVLQRVIDEGYDASLTDDELITIGKDPFLVAYALNGPDRTVVTTEVSAPAKRRQNRKVPDVCAQFNVPCINTFRLTRALGFTTQWTP